MMHKISLFFVTGAALLLAPLATSHAQRSNSRLGAFSGGGGGRSGAINSASGARGYSGAAFRDNRRFSGGHRGGYYGGGGGHSRYFYRGSYYYYDPFLFGGFGYPSYYGGFGPGFGLGYYGSAGYGYGGGYGYGEGAYGERVYNGRIASGANGRTDSEEEDERGGNGGGYSPNGMARAVQSELKERGYYRGSVDGQFGPGTAEALRKFQREKGLKVTGRLDERTLKALGFDQR